MERLRFALMNLDGFRPDGVSLEGLELSNADRWILYRLNVAAGEVMKPCRVPLQ